MSKLPVTNFSNRTGSPFNSKEDPAHEEKTHADKNKEKHNELLQKVNKKTAEYQANKPSSGVFTEVVTHGAFTSKKIDKDTTVSSSHSKLNNNGSKLLLSLPSSANDLALDAKTDLESDPNLSQEVKEKVIQKLFALASMVQHVFESKVRIMSEFDKYKDTHLKAEIRREKEHTEQLYKLNMNFQNEVVQYLQQLKSELDLSRNVGNSEDCDPGASSRDTTVNIDGNEQLNKLRDSNDLTQ